VGAGRLRGGADRHDGLPVGGLQGGGRGGQPVPLRQGEIKRFLAYSSIFTGQVPSLRAARRSKMSFTDAIFAGILQGFSVKVGKFSQYFVISGRNIAPFADHLNGVNKKKRNINR
jgi:NADH:ubiquinone oxidoreductase subunit 2 (subunit N)